MSLSIWKLFATLILCAKITSYTRPTSAYHVFVTPIVRIDTTTSIALLSGNTPLMYAAMEGNDAAVITLIRSFRRLGLDVNRTNNKGYTALILAAKHG